MLTHGQIWAALDRLAASVGLSPSGLAKRAGLDSGLVLTGVTDRAQASGAQPAPTHVADSLATLLLTS